MKRTKLILIVVLLLITLLSASTVGLASTTLAAGDIAIVGFNFDNPDDLAFVLLKDVTAGTQITFTDNGWQSSGSFRANEGSFTWTAGSNMTAGTVVNPSVSGVAFSSSGDQILAYQGTQSNPSFVYALNSEGSSWQSNATSSNTSALPTGLTDGSSAVALSEIDNAIYTGTTSGTQAELLAAISNPANWSGSNSTKQTMPTGPFTVGSGGPTATPTPTNTPTNTPTPTPTPTNTPTPTPVPPTPTPTPTSSGGSSVLAAGDIAIIGFNYDNPDELAFVLLVDIPAGTSISFTDNGWLSSGSFRSGEGTFTWTSGSAMSAGTVVNPTVSGVAFSASGDQILAYQGTSGNPTFIYALNSEGTGWQSNATSSNTSALPTGLINGTSAVAVNEIDNAVYVGTTSGSQAELLAAIGNSANWSGSDSVLQTMPTGPFTVGAGTPPTATPTPDPNATATPTPTPDTSSCPAATITGISAIQGNGLSSPMLNNTVTIRGRVVGDFQGTSELGGFFVQDTGDGNNATSDGIFVASTTAVNDGDNVQVTGKVVETNNLTQLSTVTNVTICDVAPAISAANVSLPVTAIDDLEKYEGMLITFNQTLYVNETYNLGRYGEMVLASERLWVGTNVAAPGAAANAVSAQNLLKRIKIDDYNTSQNPDPVIYPFPGLSASNTVRSGDTVAGLTGVMYYAYGEYVIEPTQAPNFVATNARTANPTSVGGTFKVASFNVLNYFNGPSFPTARGASTSAEFTRQRDKIITAILAMDADVIGLMEIENDGYGAGSAIQDLVNGLNAAASPGTTYDFVDPGVSQIGTDQIAVGFLYRVETTQLVGSAAIKEDGAFAAKNRPPLVQTFREIATNGTLTIAVNHFKSKGSACTGDPDTGDGQGNCNLTRTDAANDLTSWLATDPTGSGDSDFLIIGDLNAYAMEDPVTAIKNAGYTDVINQYNTNGYSYVFNGESGYLDHGLANTSLASQVTGAIEWHINCDEPRVLDYNVEYKTSGQISSYYSPDAYRASDHDPVIMGFNLN